MDQLAYAAVMAIEYIKLRNNSEDYDEADDAGILEDLVVALLQGSSEEKRAITAAAERLGQEEDERKDPDPERRSDYENFVEIYGIYEDDED